MQRLWQSCAEEVFLSTPSARRATRLNALRILRQAISIHALREEGDVLPQESVWHEKISIHALREEGDRRPLPVTSAALTFLSTPSARRATGCAGRLQKGWVISIHALREEGDYHTFSVLSRVF